MIFIWLVVGLVLVYDLIALNLGGYDATISATIIRANHQWTIIAVVAGIIIGHLFFGAKK